VCTVCGFILLCLRTVSPANLTKSEDLKVSLWKAYSDTAVFDWYITLTNKERMQQCDLTYGEIQVENETTVVENFLPRHRSFNIHPLRENTSYWFTMVCTDKDKRLHSSAKLHFTTDISSEREPRVGAKYSHRRSEMFPQPREAATDFSSKIIFSLKPRDKVSPHTVLGVGCGLVGFIIITVTSVLVLRKYSRFRAEQDQLWEEGYLNSDYLDCSSMELGTISLYCQQQLIADLEREQKEDENQNLEGEAADSTTLSLLDT